MENTDPTPFLSKNHSNLPRPKPAVATTCLKNLYCPLKAEFCTCHKILACTLYTALCSIIIWALFQGSKNLGYNWQWYRIPQYIVVVTESGIETGPLLKGLWVTLKITFMGFFLSFFFGLTSAMARMSYSRAARSLALVYVEVIRNTPLLIQIFFMYFVLSPILDIGAMTAAVLSLSLFEGAYASEIIRAGIVSIDPGQWDAALGSGLTTRQTYHYVVLPQALLRMLPPLASQTVSLVKDSALVSTIAVFDLTMRGQEIVASSFLTFEVWFTVAAIYLVLTLTMTGMIDQLKKRTSKHLNNRS